MGCCGDDRAAAPVKEVHKWHYINLSDFRSSNCIAFFSWLWVWALAATAVAVYTLDTFTAVKLLGFNQWSSKVQPKVSFHITKWVFAGCILFSWALCIYEWIRAVRVMKKQSVTEDYLDPLAVVLQSIRIPGGWRRFLVFAELTKSKKKAAWIAIFVYFQRKGALRILAAEGPRMVLNAITLYSVAVAKFVESPHTGTDPLVLQFLKNIRNLAVEDRMQAIVLSSMAFTLFIWVFSMIFLFAALLFWICFIAHYVDKETLTGYCRRKVETRLAKIVKAKTDKIWEKEQKRREKEEGKGIKDGDDKFDIIKRQPTLPVFDESPPKSDSFLSHNESVATLPIYTSQPQTPADDDYLPRMPLSRSDTASTGQYSANASLLGNAGQMGMSTSRPTTATSNRSFGSSYSRDQQHPPLPPLSTPLNDPRFPPSARSSPLSSSDRRYSPPGSAPWRTPVSSVDESTQEYEMQEPTLPSALRPAGPRRDMSSPGPNRGPMQPPQRSFTDPSGPGFPRSMTPGAGAGLPRSMTPGAGAGLPRSMTPGGGPPRSPPRSHTPAGGPPRSPPRSHTPGSMRSMTPGDPMRSQTPGMAQSMRPMGNSKPGGWGKGPPGMGPPGGPPGMAF